MDRIDDWVQQVSELGDNPVTPIPQASKDEMRSFQEYEKDFDIRQRKGPDDRRDDRRVPEDPKGERKLRKEPSYPINPSRSRENLDKERLREDDRKREPARRGPREEDRRQRDIRDPRDLPRDELRDSPRDPRDLPRDLRDPRGDPKARDLRDPRGDYINPRDPERERHKGRMAGSSQESYDERAQPRNGSLRSNNPVNLHELTQDFLAMKVSFLKMQEEVYLLKQCCRQQRSFEWCFPNVSSHLRHAEVGKDEFSNKFCCFASGGYCFQLRLFWNGRTKENEGSLSVYLVPVEGPYDNELYWPFDLKSTVTIISHYDNSIQSTPQTQDSNTTTTPAAASENNNNHNNNICNNNTTNPLGKTRKLHSYSVRKFWDSLGRPLPGNLKGWGWASFITHEQLLDPTKFLVKNDSIYIRVNISDELLPKSK